MDLWEEVQDAIRHQILIDEGKSEFDANEDRRKMQNIGQFHRFVLRH
jgi:hypothetical protein